MKQMSINLETPRLLLRPFSPADVDVLHGMWTEPAVRKYLWDDKVVSRETVIEVIEASSESFAGCGLGYWMICLKDTSTPVGFCGLRHFCFEDEPDGNDEVEILYGLATAQWGGGLATEASVSVLRYGFESLGLQCIYAGADPPNDASFRVMERLKMKFLKRTIVGGLEAVYYVLNRDEFFRGCRLKPQSQA